MRDRIGRVTIALVAIVVSGTVCAAERYDFGRLATPAEIAGWDIDAAARLGCATGTLNVRGLGSDAGARDVAEALDFLAAAPAEAAR